MLNEPPKKEIRLERSIRILRIFQNTLTALLSLAIAAFQGRAYATFRNTKDVKGAWPPTPFIAPTLILLCVAVAAFVFDICLLVAYLFPQRRISRWAVGVASKLYWVVPMAKTASYTVAAIVCRTGYNFGNQTKTNNDLWSWTCSKKADQFSTVNQAGSNCQIQSLAWYFSLANISIEAIGLVVNRLVEWQFRLARKRLGITNDGKMDMDTIARLEMMRMSVNTEMGQYAPTGKM